VDGNTRAERFALAEEVTLKGGYQRRPDIVLYLNGIAVAVIELKRSSVELADGCASSSPPGRDLHKGFFSTVQLVLAGSDSQAGTAPPARRSIFFEWKDEAPGAAGGAPAPGALLDRPLGNWSENATPRPVRNCMLFDAGHKRCPARTSLRLKAAQARIARREGGVIWHTRAAAEHPDGADRQVVAGARPRAAHPRRHPSIGLDRASRAVTRRMRRLGVVLSSNHLAIQHHQSSCRALGVPDDAPSRLAMRAARPSGRRNWCGGHLCDPRESMQLRISRGVAFSDTVAPAPVEQSAGAGRAASRTRASSFHSTKTAPACRGAVGSAPGIAPRQHELHGAKSPCLKISSWLVMTGAPRRQFH